MSLRTDLAIVQYPSPLPVVGDLYGMNTIYTDPNFGSKVVRLTDGSVSKAAKTGFSYSMKTASSAQVGIWNTDETLIMPATGGGGKRYVFQFDPVAMQGKLLPYTFGNKAVFSNVDPCVVYTVVGTKIQKHTFKLVNGVYTSPSYSTLCDFMEILPTGFKVNYTSMFVQSIDDSTFAFCFSEGPQDTAHHVCVWKKGKGYRMLDTASGMISGQWGENGKASIIAAPSGAASPVFPFALHEASSNVNPLYINMGASGKVPQGGGNTLEWIVDTTIIQALGQIGHNAKGMLHTYGGGAGNGQVSEVPYANPKVPYRKVVPPNGLPKSLGQTFAQDRHFSFGKIDPLDASIVWSTCGGPVVVPLLSAWECEVIGYDVVKGVVYRACHTLNSNKSKEFDIMYAVGTPSPRFVAFNSDMMGALGSNAGKAAGTVGVDARGDVFIVKVA